MNQSIMKDWIDALRSGKYTQGTKGLCKAVYNITDVIPVIYTITDPVKDKYCALGVLCEVLNLQKTVQLIQDNKKSTVTKIVLFDGQAGQLSKQALELSEFKSPCGGKLSKKYTVVDFETNHLIVLNDNGMSFNDLANIIEKEWTSL